MSTEQQIVPTTTRDLDGTLIVRLAGELDMATAEGVTRYLEDCVREGHRRIVVDLEDVSFIDSTGLSSFVVIHALLAGAGGQFMLCNARPNVQMAIELTGLNRVIGM